MSGMKRRSEKNRDGDEERDAEARAAYVTPHDPLEEGEQTLIRRDHHHREEPEEPGEELKPEETEETQGTSERSEVGIGEELLFKGTSKSDTKINSRRKEQSSLVKQGKNAMMSSVSPREGQPSSKAKRSFKTMYDERMRSLRTDGLSSGYDSPGLMHSEMDLTLNPRQEKSKKALSDSPTRPMSDGITMGASSTYDKLMMSIGTKKGGASSSTRLQPQMTSSSLSLTPVLGTAGDVSDMLTGVMTGLEKLRRNMTKRIDRVEERAQQVQKKLQDELTDVKSQARTDQAQLIRNTDQCLAKSLALAARESDGRYNRMTREIEQLLKDHDNSYANTMTSLGKRLDAKADLMMRKLDEILSSGHRKDLHAPTDESRRTTDGGGARGHAGAQPSSRTGFQSRAGGLGEKS